jgi:hypothetical protein
VSAVLRSHGDLINGSKLAFLKMENFSDVSKGVEWKERIEFF